MSLADVFIELGRDVMPDVLAEVANGEMRVLATTPSTAAATDDSFFFAPTVEPSVFKFLPCLWEVNTQNSRDADERLVAAQVRGLARYRLTVPRRWQGFDIDIRTDDVIELKQVPGHNESAITLTVLAPVNVSNVVWEIIAIDTNA